MTEDVESQVLCSAVFQDENGLRKGNVRMLLQGRLTATGCAGSIGRQSLTAASGG